MKAFEELKKRKEKEYGKGMSPNYWMGLEEGWRESLEWAYDYLGYSEEDKRVKDIIQKEHDSE